ncbi:MAG: hypothetical protein ACI4QH_02320 [Candidatus Fimimonas sp.]
MKFAAAPFAAKSCRKRRCKSVKNSQKPQYTVQNTQKWGFANIEHSVHVLVFSKKIRAVAISSQNFAKLRIYVHFQAFFWHFGATKGVFAKNCSVRQILSLHLLRTFWQEKTKIFAFFFNLPSFFSKILLQKNSISIIICLISYLLWA